MKNIMKTLMLISLIGLSLFQLTRLWFDDLSDSNLFYNVSTTNIKSPKQYFVKPTTEAIYFLKGREGYSLIPKNNKDFDDLFRLSMNIISTALTEGELIEDISQEVRWEKGNILLKYDYDIEPSILLADLNIKNSTLDQMMISFDEIVIVPDTQGTKAYIYFVDDAQTNNIIGYLLRNNADDMVGNVEMFLNDLKDKTFPYYQSSRQLDLSMFTRNFLLPGTSIFESNTIYLSQPFYTEGVLDKQALENYIKVFFVYNDFAVGGFDDENVNPLTYIDLQNDVHVNYYKNGFVEYTASVSNSKKEISITDAFYVAEQFITQRDGLIDNIEYSLAYYEMEGNKARFGFKYAHKGIDMVIGEDVLGELNMIYPIEITVDNGRVSNYRRYLLSIDSRSEQETYPNNYEKATNQTVQQYPNEKFKNVSLGYYLDEDLVTMKLHWVVVTENGHLYKEPIN